MSKRASIIYLCIAPFLLLLSWYTSHRMYTDFLQNQAGNFQYHGKERSWTYAIVLTVIYLAVFVVIKNLYRTPKSGRS